MTGLVEQAVVFASKAHEGVVRQGSGEPYVMHPIAVIGLLLYGYPMVTPTMMAAAALHDVVEDTIYTVQDLRNHFGHDVAKLVEELSEPRPRIGKRRRRVQAEVERLRVVSSEAQTIKYCDILHNLSDIDQYRPDFAAEYKAEKRLAISAMADGHEALRQDAWLATFPVKGKHRGIVD